MSTLRSEWLSTPDFHPEFGLLCPSFRRRRGMRLVIASVMAGLAIGATIELAFAHWRDNDVAPAPAIRSIHARPLAEGAPAVLEIPVVSAQPPASADVEKLTTARPLGFCKEGGAEDLVAVFLNPTCGSGKPHARHGARTVYRVATVIVGRTETSSASEAAEPTRVAPAIEPSHAIAAVMANAATSTTQPVGRPMPPKKPKITLSAPIALGLASREPTQQAVGASAFAAMPQLGRGYSGRPGAVER
jgi:hypothetical protein